MRKEKEDREWYEQELERKLEGKMKALWYELEAERLEGESKKEIIKLIVVVVVSLAIYTIGEQVLADLWASALALGKAAFFSLIDWMWLV